MSSFPLTKSIIFQDGYYNTTKQYTILCLQDVSSIVFSQVSNFSIVPAKKKQTTARFTAAAGFHQFSPSRRSAPQKPLQLRMSES
jgi:hypothetical protein